MLQESRFLKLATSFKKLVPRRATNAPAPVAASAEKTSAEKPPSATAAGPTHTPTATPTKKKASTGRFRRFVRACVPRMPKTKRISDTPTSTTPITAVENTTPATEPISTATTTPSPARRNLAFQHTSPLAAGLQKPSAGEDDFVIAAFSGKHSPAPRLVHLTPKTGAVAPAPSPLSPAVKTASEAVTLADVQHKLPAIFEQLPAAKVSPQKKTLTVTAVIDASAGETENWVATFPTIEEAKTPEAKKTPAPGLASPKRSAKKTPSTSTVDPVTPSKTNIDSDDYAHYAWGNSGHTIRLSAANAAALGMKCKVDVSAADVIAEKPARKCAVFWLAPTSPQRPAPLPRVAPVMKFTTYNEGLEIRS